MATPKISLPTFTVEIPSNKKKESFRLMIVKEEKILLLAKQSQDKTDISAAVKQIVRSMCDLTSFRR